jgi:signal transduction histidine kinase
VNDHVERYRRFFGLEFEVDVTLKREVTGPIAAELFHFLVEGMSNVLKHTRSKKGSLHIREDGAHVRVCIANDIPRGFTPQPFVPRSIAERVESLGGELTVEPNQDGRTLVSAAIPA